MVTQGPIMKPDPEKGIKLYVDANFAGIWNQEEGKDPGLVLSITGYMVNPGTKINSAHYYGGGIHRMLESFIADWISCMDD